jgi:hypothetical protein
MFAFNPIEMPSPHMMGYPSPVMEPQVQDFAAPIVNQQGMPVGEVHVHKETVQGGAGSLHALCSGFHQRT